MEVRMIWKKIYPSNICNFSRLWIVYEAIPQQELNLRGKRNDKRFTKQKYTYLKDIQVQK